MLQERKGARTRTSKSQATLLTEQINLYLCCLIHQTVQEKHLFSSRPRSLLVHFTLEVQVSVCFLSSLYSALQLGTRQAFHVSKLKIKNTLLYSLHVPWRLYSTFFFFFSPATLPFKLKYIQVFLLVREKLSSVYPSGYHLVTFPFKYKFIFLSVFLFPYYLFSPLTKSNQVPSLFSL